MDIAPFVGQVCADSLGFVIGFRIFAGELRNNIIFVIVLIHRNNFFAFIIIILFVFEGVTLFSCVVCHPFF